MTLESALNGGGDWDSQVQVMSSVGSSGMSSPRSEFLNYWYAEFRDYYFLMSNVGDEADYRIKNACEEMIGIVDSVAKQNELREYYRELTDVSIARYCGLRGCEVGDLSESEVQYLGRDVANKVVGRVTAWIGEYYPLHRPQIIGVCRGPPGYDGEPRIQVKQEPGVEEWNIAEYYARILTGKTVLDVSQLTEGFRGSGKSRKDLALGERIAAWESFLLDNDPSVKGSRNYFYEDCIAVIKAAASQKVMKMKGKYLVKMFDDITAYGWNSRDSITKKNKEKNATFMVNRVERQAQLLSCPDLFTLDKVPREMASHICVMSKETGIKELVEHSMSKLYEVDKNFRASVQLFKLPVFKNSSVAFVVYPRCTKQIEEWYDNVRVKYENMPDEEEVEEINVAKKSRSQIKAEKTFALYEEAIQRGMTPMEARAEVHLAKQTLKNWIDRGWVPSSAIL